MTVSQSEASTASDQPRPSRIARGTALLFPIQKLQACLQACEGHAAPHLGHEREELVEQAGYERLDGVQVVRVEGVHQVAQRGHRVHAHLRTLGQDSQRRR